MNDNLRAQLDALPTQPGIYKYFDQDGELIYVGKAVNLKNRVRSYFSGPQTPKTQVLVNNIERLETIVVQSEIDALILEANLIKEHKPRYNIILKDDKSHLYIAITAYETLPRIFTRRQTDLSQDRRATYFGPYPSSGIVKQTLRYLRKVFPYLAHHQPPVTGRRRPPQSFFYYNLPLIAQEPLDQKEYRRQIFQLIHFLEGKRTLVAAELEKELKKAVKKLEFEQAADIKRQLDNITYMTQQKISPETYLANPELMAEKREEGLAELAKILTAYFPSLEDAFNDRNSPLETRPLHRVECYDISNTGGKQAVGSMVVFLDGEASKSDYRKFRIKRENVPNDVAMMTEVLRRRLKRLSVVGDQSDTPVEDSKAEAPKLKSDTSFSAIPDLIVIDGGKGQLAAVNQVLAEYGLDIPVVGLTKREEELVIALKATARGSHHPSQNEDPADDEFLTAGRLARAGDDAAPKPASSISKPNRSSAHAAIARTEAEARTQIIHDTHYVTVRLPRGSEALFFIQRLRDEAHRFAITYHRQLRGKSFLSK